MKKPLWGVVAAGAAVCGALGAGWVRPDESAQRPVVAWMGDNSLVTTARYERITTRERWEEVWREHSSERPHYQHPAFAASPEIDFGRYMVVACFRGKATNNAGERVESIAEVDGALRVRFDSMSYQTSSGVLHLKKSEFDPNDPGALVVGDRGNATTPYGIWVIERTDKPVVLEEGVRGLKADPVTWKEQHRFEALGK